MVYQHICVLVLQITELLTDVERLKQALSGLSQLAYTSNTPSKRQSQHTDAAMQAQIKSLQQQLAVSTHALHTGSDNSCNSMHIMYLRVQTFFCVKTCRKYVDNWIRDLRIC